MAYTDGQFGAASGSHGLNGTEGWITLPSAWGNMSLVMGSIFSLLIGYTLGSAFRHLLEILYKIP